MTRPIVASGVAQSVADPDFPQFILKVNADGTLTIRGAPFTYTPLGYQQIINPAAATNLTVPTGATMALISVSAASARWRDDGTAPTAAIGMPMTAGQEFQYSGNLAAIQFIGAGATLDISYYK